MREKAGMPTMSRIKDKIIRQREMVLLKYITQFWIANRYSPSQEDMLDFLATELPHRPDGKPVVFSKQQIQRLLNRLRKQGLLTTTPANLKRVAAPTLAGERIVQEVFLGKK